MTYLLFTRKIMFQFQFINEPTSFQIDTKEVERIFSLVSEQVPRVQQGILNLAFVSDEVMQGYNKEYRKKDSTTDVLSFHYFDDLSDCWDGEIAWEILFSESRILLQAEEHHHIPLEEFQILLIHSLLHVLWFDHENDDEHTLMWKYESELRGAYHLT